MKPKHDSARQCLAAVLASTLTAATGQTQLNDTGVQLCSDGATLGLVCDDMAAGTDALPGQDAEYGRDVSDADPNDGKAGFSFTKLDRDGFPLENQQSDYQTQPWACVLDNVTGLVWEIKTDDGGLQDKDWTYSWFTSSGVNDAGFPGFENAGTCADETHCDTEKYIDAVNATMLCGLNNWRLPSPAELQSVVVYGDQPLVFPPQPVVDLDYFPNSLPQNYYTAVSLASVNVQAWVVYFGIGSLTTEGKTPGVSVRLVQGGTE